MKLRIIKYPDLLLTKKSTPVLEIDDEVKRLANDMVETMQSENGIGISAVQVGVLKRIMVVSVRKGSFDPSLYPEVMINPRVISKEGFQKRPEGCLSFPGHFIPVNRYDTLEVEYQNIEGHVQRAVLQDIESVCFQHEMDHLDGVLFINKSSSGGLAGKIRI